MGKIDELIKELCPDGVEYVKLGEIATLSRGKVYSKEYVTENAGVYPLYSSQTRNDGIFGLISSFDYEGEYLTWTTDGAYAGSIFHRKGKFSITNVCGLITIKNKCISYRFLYYWLSIHAKEYVYEGMGNPKLMTNQMIGIQIPLPPLSIQQQIVEILDTFTDSISNLQEELALREKQMEYYRESLLSFDGENVEYVKLGGFCEIKRGIRVIKKELSDSGVYPVFQNSLTPLGYYDKTNCAADKTFIIMAGAAGEIGYTDEPIWAADDCFYIDTKDILYNKYTFYNLLNCQHYLKSKVRKASIPRLSRNFIEDLLIPLPSLSRQREIVDILDTFESMISNIKEEIELRQTQYEYYREKLLTFERKEA